MRKDRHGFSLIELLVVIGIIVLLIGILLPVVSLVQHSARSTVCLAHLQQLGDCYLAYANANGGHSFPSRQTITQPAWWELLQQHNAGLPAVLLCPEATEPGNVNGSATAAWGPERTYSVGAPKWIMRAQCIGSYGLNLWLDELAPEDRAVASTWWLSHAIHRPPRHAAEIPVLGDCVWSFGLPQDTDAVPSNLVYPAGPLGGMVNFCIDRHRLAINIVFLDGHAERVPLARLWKLHWNDLFKPTDVIVP